MQALKIIISFLLQVISIFRTESTSLDAIFNNIKEGDEMPSAGFLEMWFSCMEAMAESVLRTSLREYLDNTSLHGPRYLSEPRRLLGEKILWLVVQLLAVWGVVVVIIDVWNEYVNTPTVTTVDSTAFPIWRVPFPAVAVCNINRISLSSARQMAKRLSQKKQISEEEALLLLQIAGHLYDHDAKNDQKISALHSLLGPQYNVTHIMLSLTPRCDELLVRCSWRGVMRNCSELFVMRKTMDGFCCAFNYVRENDKFVSNEGELVSEEKRQDNPVLRVDAPGCEMGLSVLVNPNSQDYFYPLMSSYGTKVFVFNPGDYPDTPTGGLIEKLVPLSSEVFFRLDATSTWSTPGVQDFTEDKRGCLFQSELAELFAGYYSYSDCLMNCRIRSIQVHCDCLPFYFPSRGYSKECTLLDIQCLSKYKEKWSTLQPMEDIPGLQIEREDSISCSECRPACTDTVYHVQTTAAPITNNFVNSPFLENITLNNHSVFHLFFGSANTMRLKQDVLYYWYELLSNFGGICGLFVGFSLISIVELVYFFTIRLFFKIRDDNVRVESQSNRKHRGEKGRLKMHFYWQEMRNVNHRIPTE